MSVKVNKYNGGIYDKNGIYRLFTKNTRTKILCHFLLNPNNRFNKTDLVEEGILKNRREMEIRKENGHLYGYHDEPLIEIGILERDGYYYSLNHKHHLIPILESIYLYQNE